MSVTVRKYRKGGFEVDIRLEIPGGTTHRERRKAPVRSRSAAKRWGEARERELWLRAATATVEVERGRARRQRRARPRLRKEVPTLSEFRDRFLDGYARANRQKASGIDSKESILRHHLEPALGNVPLDSITDERIARLKAAKTGLSVKTVNNILSVLSVLLDVAVEWNVIDRKPSRIRLLKVPEPAVSFYDFGDYERLVRAARRCGRRILVTVLLAGDAGLRRGEIVGLEQSDLDFDRGLIHVQRSVWKGIADVPKGRRSRRVPMSRALREALGSHRHLAGAPVLYRNGGEPVTEKVLRSWLAQAQRRAGLKANGGLHILRHTFCSHLAMRGAPAKAIQELAGHRDLSTTLRYMHLSPAARDSAIRLLDERPAAEGAADFGDILETVQSGR